MKRITALTSLMLCGALLFGVCLLIAQNKKEKQSIMMATEDMKWETMKGAPPGVTYCTLWGDIEKGAYGAIIKLPPNLNNPLHSHSFDTKCVVIEGSFYMTQDGGTEKVFGPGSYFMEPGWMKHMSGTKEQGATIFQEGPGKFDFNMAEMPKKKM